MSEDHVETFESVDAGASTTFPQQAGTIRKNGFIVINNRPCKARAGGGHAAGMITAVAVGGRPRRGGGAPGGAPARYLRPRAQGPGKAAPPGAANPAAAAPPAAAAAGGSAPGVRRRGRRPAPRRHKRVAGA